MVVLQGCVLRALKKGRGGIQENDVVIVDFERKAIICIEFKATLTGRTGQKAVKQTLELKRLLEEYFAAELSSGDWCFVGVIYTNKVNAKQPICPDCSHFIIEGPLSCMPSLQPLKMT